MSGIADGLPVRSVDLAPQVGGSHEALAWGALGRLPADPRIAIRKIGGTGAGRAEFRRAGRWLDAGRT
jgi:hypothetical protein